MRKTATALAVLTLAAAGWAPLAQAADVSQPVQTLDLSSGSTSFTHTIAAGNAGATFTDSYAFTLAGASKLVAQVTGFSFPDLGGVNFTGFSLVNSANMSLAGTKIVDSGGVMTWLLTAQPLMADTYHLVVTGTSLNAMSTTYVGSVGVSAVPEPETYAMLLGGLGMLGFIGRRRKS